MKFLVVDDSKTLVRVISQSLRDLGHTVVGEAYDGFEGFEKFKSLNPEIILLDVTMPNRDGRECLVDILSMNPRAHVIMLSAIKTKDVIEDCLKIGAKEFIHKDDLINKEAFSSHILRIVGQRQIAA